jgi:hypothetical protein
VFYNMLSRRVSGRWMACALAGMALLGAGVVSAVITDLGEIAVVHQAAAEHADQAELNGLPADERFVEAFELGDELFATSFNALDGGGANVGRGQRFTRVPRADMHGPGEWYMHKPERVTGPNASGCFECHEQPFEDGSGTPAQNVHRDPFRTGIVSQFVERNTPHIFAMGAIQRLAEEMTDELSEIEKSVQQSTCTSGNTRSATLMAKGINFGTLAATRTRANPCAVSWNTSGVRGIDFEPSVENPTAGPNLIVRSFQWKGSVAFIRDFNRGASHNELGMQAVEIVGDNVDGDFDGVVNEMTIGDQTALAVYAAAQPRPTTLVELNSLRLLEPALTVTQLFSIMRGQAVFQAIGCGGCHISSLPLEDPIFSEPSQNPAFRDGTNFPAGQSTAVAGVVPSNAIKFDLSRDQPDNVIRDSRGNVVARLGSFTRRDSRRRVLIELYGDLKRHAMGPGLAEPVNEIAGDDVTPIPSNPANRHTPDTFLTENLWGVGSTAPYMHDGRATTLAEAILAHAASDSDNASEARASRAAYRALPDRDKRALIAFLQNLVLFKIPEEEEAAATAAATSISSQPETVQGRIARRVRIMPRGFRFVRPE